MKPFYTLAVKTTWKELLDKAQTSDFLTSYIATSLQPMAQKVNLTPDKKFDVNLFIISKECTESKASGKLLEKFREFLISKDALNEQVFFNPSYRSCRGCDERFKESYFIIDEKTLHKPGDQTYDKTLELLKKCGFEEKDIIHMIF